MNIARRKQPRTIQEQFPGTYLFLGFSGIYIPDVDKLLTSTITRKVLYPAMVKIYYILVPWIFIHIVAMSVSIMLNKLPPLLFFSLVRRTVAGFYAGMRAATGIYRKNKVKELYDTFNEEHYGDKNSKRRKEILEVEIKNARGMMATVYVFYGALIQIFAIRFILNPYASWSAYLWVIHSIESPIHLLVCSIFISVTLTTTAGYCADHVIAYHILVMLKTELMILQESLEKIITALPVNADGVVQLNPKAKYIQQRALEKELKEWVKKHIRVLWWADKIVDYYKLYNIIKYSFLGAYLTLVSFSSLYTVREGQIAESILIIPYAAATFYIQFFTTQITDDINEKSGQIFYHIYDKQWYSHSNEVKQILRIIGIFNTHRPIRFRFLSIFEDNSESFSAIVSMAYKGYSILVSSF